MLQQNHTKLLWAVKPVYVKSKNAKCFIFSNVDILQIPAGSMSVIWLLNAQTEEVGSLG